MTLRFLQTTASSNPDYPFQAGQQINVPRLTPELRAAIKAGYAMVLKDEPERAVTDSPERAVTQKAKR